MSQTITIVGAGIGGLTTALALQQKGFKVEVFESAEAIRPVGAGILLAINAMQVYKRLGLQEKLEERGHKISCMKLTDETLKPLSIVSLPAFAHKYGVTSLAIHRAQLQSLLASEIGSEHIHLNKRLTEISEANGYTLRFEDGTTHHAAVVVGADGIHSLVRKQLFKTSKIRNTQQQCWRGVLSFKLPAGFQHEANELWGKGKRFGFVQIDNEQVYWYALSNRMEAVEELDKAFKGFHPLVEELIKATPVEGVFQNEIIDLQPFSTWQRQHLCLLGDAAHATTPNLGQGACQAVEDAYVLAEAMVNEKDVSAAFKHYERVRIKKAHTIVNISWHLGKLAHVENSLGVRLRNAMMRSMPQAANKRQLDMIFKLAQ